MTERRFLVNPHDITPDAESGAPGTAIVRGTEHHHLKKVLRLREGADVAVFDGQGRGFKGRIERIDRDESSVRLSVPESQVVEPRLHLTLAQGIPHHEKMEWIIQKGTELGVSRFIPIIAHHGVVRPRDEAWSRLERWQRTAAEAARQCGRLLVPEVQSPAGWAETIAAWTAHGPGAGFLLSTRAQALGEGWSVRGFDPHPKRALLAVGPEGGFSEEEEDAAVSQGLLAISLGPRVLRTETAAVAGATLVMFLAGDLGPARQRI